MLISSNQNNTVNNSVIHNDASSTSHSSSDLSKDSQLNKMRFSALNALLGLPDDENIDIPHSEIGERADTYEIWMP